MSMVPNEFICVHAGGDRASCLVHWGAKLPAESCEIYAEAIVSLRAQGRRLVQITNLEGDGGTVAMRRLFRAVLAEAVRHDANDVIACVSPDSARAYCTILGFDELLPDEPPRPWEPACDEFGKPLPTRLIGLAIGRVPEGVLERFLESE